MAHTTTTKPNTTSSISNNSEKQNPQIDWIFLRFAAIYGHIWKSLYKSEEFLNYTKREWQKGLEKFNHDVLDKAVVHCSEKESYPPSLPLFIEICKSHVRQPAKVSDIEKPQPCDPRIAHQHLEKIRQILKGAVPLKRRSYFYEMQNA